MKNGAIIINFNDSARVINLINKLSSFLLFSDIVVVDNASSKEDREALIGSLTCPNLHLVLNSTNKGFNQAVNDGLYFLADRKVDTAFAINSDVDVSKDTLQSLTFFLEKHKDYGAVSCPMIEGGVEKQMYYDFPTLHFEITNDLGLVKLFHKKPTIREDHGDFIRVDFVRSSLVAFNMEAVEKAGYFDGGTFLYFGEAIMGLRLQKLGYKEACLIKPMYFHYHIYRHGYKKNGYRMNYRDSLYLFQHYYHVSKLGFFRLKVAYRIGYVIRILFGVFR